jgi:predicted MFS family arabinose efflux permease
MPTYNYGSDDSGPKPPTDITVEESDGFGDDDETRSLLKVFDANLAAENAKALNPWSLANVAIFLSYFCVGFGFSFSGTPLTYYLINELEATAEQLVVIGVVGSLPWSFKLLYGFLSDSLPINGQRRKPYFVLGWLIYVAANLWLATMARPTMEWIAGLLLLQTMGYMCSDVMTDTMVVERSKRHETMEERGTFQATGYTARTAGNCVGSVLGAVLYNKSEWGCVFLFFKARNIL